MPGSDYMQEKTKDKITTLYPKSLKTYPKLGNWTFDFEETKKALKKKYKILYY